jgi:hypothetical protein
MVPEAIRKYALARKCSVCGAGPNEECRAPQLTTRAAARDRRRAEFGAPPATEPPAMHGRRLDLGARAWRKAGQP